MLIRFFLSYKGQTTNKNSEIIKYLWYNVCDDLADEINNRDSDINLFDFYNYKSEDKSKNRAKDCNNREDDLAACKTANVFVALVSNCFLSKDSRCIDEYNTFLKNEIFYRERITIPKTKSLRNLLENEWVNKIDSEGNRVLDHGKMKDTDWNRIIVPNTYLELSGKKAKEIAEIIQEEFLKALVEFYNDLKAKAESQVFITSNIEHEKNSNVFKEKQLEKLLSDSNIIYSATSLNLKLLAPLNDKKFQITEEIRMRWEFDRFYLEHSKKHIHILFAENNFEISIDDMISIGDLKKKKFVFLKDYYTEEDYNTFLKIAKDKKNESFEFYSLNWKKDEFTLIKIDYDNKNNLNDQKITPFNEKINISLSELHSIKKLTAKLKPIENE